MDSFEGRFNIFTLRRARRQTERNELTPDLLGCCEHTKSGVNLLDGVKSTVFGVKKFVLAIGAHYRGFACGSSLPDNGTWSPLLVGHQ